MAITKIYGRRAPLDLARLRAFRAGVPHHENQVGGPRVVQVLPGATREEDPYAVEDLQRWLLRLELVPAPVSLDA